MLFENSNVGQDILPVFHLLTPVPFLVVLELVLAFGPDPLLIESSQDLLLLPNRKVRIVGSFFRYVFSMKAIESWVYGFLRGSSHTFSVPSGSG